MTELDEFLRASNIIAEKFSELVDSHNPNRLVGLTRAERAIYLLIRIRCEKDMEGFDSIFDQAISRHEMLEAIVYMKELGLNETAQLFEQVLQLLSNANVYVDGDFPQMASPHDVDVAIDIIGEQVGDVLWQIDEKLLEMLEAEQKGGT
jgi:hypothetical protein